MSPTATKEVTDVRIVDTVRYCINICQSCLTRYKCSKYVTSTAMRLTSVLTEEVTLYCFRQTECNLYSCVYVRRKVLRFNETHRKRSEQKLRANRIVLSLHDIHQYFYVTNTPYDTVFSTNERTAFRNL